MPLEVGQVALAVALSGASGLSATIPMFFFSITHKPKDPQFSFVSNPLFSIVLGILFLGELLLALVPSLHEKGGKQAMYVLHPTIAATLAFSSMCTLPRWTIAYNLAIGASVVCGGIAIIVHLFKVFFRVRGGENCLCQCAARCSQWVMCLIEFAVALVCSWISTSSIAFAFLFAFLSLALAIVACRSLLRQSCSQETGGTGKDSSQKAGAQQDVGQDDEAVSGGWLPTLLGYGRAAAHQLDTNDNVKTDRIEQNAGTDQQGIFGWIIRAKTKELTCAKGDDVEKGDMPRKIGAEVDQSSPAPGVGWGQYLPSLWAGESSETVRPPPENTKVPSSLERQRPAASEDFKTRFARHVEEYMEELAVQHSQQ
jgi:hypothetical protein